MTLWPVRDAAVAPKGSKKKRSISNVAMKVRYGKMIGKLTLKSAAAAGNFHKNRLIASRELLWRSLVVAQKL